MNEKSVIYLICRECDDSWYPGHPDGIAFETEEMAKKYIEDNYPNNDEDLEYQSGHYITEIKLFG
jgi:hypothetical protein